jgi:hypothetical protein
MHPFARGTSCENVELFRNYLFQMLRFKRKLQGSENAENGQGLGAGVVSHVRRFAQELVW